MIALEGNIGCGKSTVLSKLSEKGYTVLPEIVKEWNKEDWLNDFYELPEENGFSFQMKVLHSHLSKEKGIKKTNSSIFTERSAYTSHNCFGRLLYEDDTITKRNYYLMNDYYESFSKLPTKIIYLKTDPKVCLERIKLRGRETETNISIDYLNKLHLKHEKFLITSPPDCDIITIDGNLSEENLYKKVIELMVF
tara:strand:- start:2923 stop:3504 length:582 start_codon:yes stop_codon:yes gene_type:complete